MILIDTTPLVALCDARDAKHRSAVVKLAALANDELAVCEPVLAEACFHLPHENQRHRLRAVLDEFSIDPWPVAYERGLWSEVFDWLANYADHEPDWADACLAVLCGRERSLKVWTFDREFRTTWRRPNGTAIPLA